jgi:hypothetical protein
MGLGAARLEKTACRKSGSHREERRSIARSFHARGRSCAVMTQNSTCPSGDALERWDGASTGSCERGEGDVKALCA